MRAYLGSIKDMKRRVNSDFDEIKRRMGQKLAGYKTRTLSVAGQVVLIKFDLTD